MEISGVIDSVETFESIVQEIRERRAYSLGYGLPYRQEYFRGQLSSEWLVKPSISRGLNSVEQVQIAEKKVMNLFTSQIKDQNCLDKVFLHENPKNYQNEWLWLSQAQHYGVPTRLIDWTLKPEVALYFAVENCKFDNLDGQILVIYVPSEIEKTEGTEYIQYYETSPFDLAETWFLNPGFFSHDKFNEATAEIRRARQHGKFIMQPFTSSIIGLDEQPDFLKKWNTTFEPVLEKYIIPHDSKAQIRSDLDRKGWHGQWLYANHDPVINKIRDDCKLLLNDEVNKQPFSRKQKG